MKHEQIPVLRGPVIAMMVSGLIGVVMLPISGYYFASSKMVGGCLALSALAFLIGSMKSGQSVRLDYIDKSDV